MVMLRGLSDSQGPSLKEWYRIRTLAVWRNQGHDAIGLSADEYARQGIPSRKCPGHVSVDNFNLK